MREGKAASVMIMPGGPFQLALVRKANARGWKTIVTDMDPNCVCSREAGEFHACGIDDRAALLVLATRLRPDGIVTDQTDAAVPVVGMLTDALGIPGNGVELAQLFTNKALMRRYGEEKGFPTPQYRTASSVTEALSSAAAIGYPVVVKPPASQSSNGVYVVYDDAEMREAFGKAASFARADNVIVEQFIDGTEFTVEGFMTSIGHKTLAISQKGHFSDCPTVACSLRYTPDNAHFDYDRLSRQHDAMLDNSGLRFGLTHAEYKFSAGEFFLIEFAARGGGTRIASDIVPWVSGVDVLEKLLDHAVEGHSDPIPDGILKRCALLEFLQVAPGIVKSIEGLEAVCGFPGVCAVKINYGPGERIPPVASDTSRPGYFILQTETEGELDILRTKVLETLKVHVEATR